MELLKEFRKSGALISGEDVNSIDVTNGISFNNIGEVRVQNPVGDYTGLFAVGDEIEVKAGFRLDDGTPAIDTVFKGYVEDMDGDALIVYKLTGLGLKLRSVKYKKSYHVISAERILKDLLAAAGVTAETGSIPRIERHSYICPNKTIIQEIERFSQSFGLGLIPYFNRTGTLVVKDRESNIKETDVVYADGDFRSFENNLLDVFVDIEIEAFDKIKILEDDYIVSSNRIILNDDETRSLIAVTKT